MPREARAADGVPTDGPDTLSFHGVDVRAVDFGLKRPVAAGIATITDWTPVLIGLKTGEGIVGRGHLEPCMVRSMTRLVPALRRTGAMPGGKGTGGNP